MFVFVFIFIWDIPYLFRLDRDLVTWIYKRKINVMKHLEVYEAFGWETMGTGRLIIEEGEPSYRPDAQSRINDMQKTGELTIVDMSTCDEEEIEEAVASNAAKVLFINGDDCDRAIRYTVMDLHPEIIPATSLTPEDLITQ
jgi:hypothetical protein